jgi:L-threonylcarbamoyladenylate synthase
MAAEGAALQTVAVDHPDAVDRAAAVLRAGGTVVLPTDTVYGVAALPSVPGATGKLFALKDRAEGQPLAVLVGDLDQVWPLVQVDRHHEVLRRWAARLWPGPLTVVLPRSSSARSLELGGSPDTVGVRCPDHDFVRQLADQVGPVATTSANRHGEPTPVTAAAAARSLVGPVDLVVDGGPAGTLASTVVDLTAAEWAVLRTGALDEQALRDVAG